MVEEGDRQWVGMIRHDGDEPMWSLPVSASVTSGAGALFGGSATAAALVAASDIVEHPLLWSSMHFGAQAREGVTVTVTAELIASGRTMSHVSVSGVVGGKEVFTARVAAGRRPDPTPDGQWILPPDVPVPQACPLFDHPVHRGTWAERFDWRFAGSSGDRFVPWAAWWVRSREALSPRAMAAVLCDYVTYGVGRAVNQPAGGLSIDNVLRLHRPDAASEAEWLLVQVVPEAFREGFGAGSARLFAGQHLVATGSQSMIMNGWDWRLPAERD